MRLQEEKEETGKPVRRLALVCDMHKTAKVLIDQMALAAYHISGMVSVALTERQPGAHIKSREAFAAVLLSRATVVRHRPELSDAALDFKQAVLESFLPATSDANRVARLLLQRYVVGDWRERESAVYAAPDEEDATAMAILEGELPEVFLGSVLPIFPRPRWTGADIVAQRFAVLSSVHCCLGDVLKLWVRLLPRKGRIDIKAEATRLSDEDLVRGQAADVGDGASSEERSIGASGQEDQEEVDPHSGSVQDCWGQKMTQGHVS